MRGLVLATLVVLAAAPRGPRPRPLTIGSNRATRPWIGSGVHRAIRSRWNERGSRSDRMAASLPDLLESTARSRRAGMSLLASLGVAADLVPAAQLSSVLTRVEAGATMATALDDWAASAAHSDADLVVAVLLLSDESGAAVAARLDRAAATLRQRSILAAEVRALTSQARASATVVALAPVAFAAVVAMTDDRFLGLMFGTSIGRISLVVGVLLDAVGVWWMRRLTARVGA